MSLRPEEPLSGKDVFSSACVLISVMRPLECHWHQRIAKLSYPNTGKTQDGAIVSGLLKVTQFDTVNNQSQKYQQNRDSQDCLNPFHLQLLPPDQL